MERVPDIRVEPPGPEARNIIEKDQKLLMQSYVRWYPLVIKTGHGAVVEDVDGNKYVDMNAGIAVMALGHNHPKVVEAIKREAEKLQHYSLTDFYYEEAVRSAEKLLSVVPIKNGRVFYTNSGTESIEGALKIARYYHEGKRQYIIAFLGAFHGRTMGSLSLTASKAHYREHYAPLVPGVIHVPYPYTYRCPFNTDDPKECGQSVLDYIEDWIFTKLVEPTEVAAIFVEPIQGEGGYIVPPDNFLPGLRKIADKYKILLVDDEVQSGIARTGKWFAIENWNVVPDIIAMAKAIGGGLPLGAIVAKSEVMDSMKKGSHANTFGGNPIALAAMEAVIDTIKEEKLTERASKLGDMVIKYFNDLKEELEIIGDVRGKGLMIGVELVRNKKTKEPASKELGRILEKSFKRGVLVIGSGVSSIRIAPPLVIEEDLLAKAIEIVGDILKEENKSL
ncbi:acetyl ornithine aminotransferase family protein [Caldisphaera sp.]|uniref:acetyl ornithine aminotransferase family protein n=1 Tax=Caldisphaera sp. TaxID=2060322 RepID=UPI0025C472D0|nr:acetyl ornithine aminotransferase family protein [Caldisphaera sp.]